jgi:drug/metabolite transporter (DMT)-like permease
MEPAPTDAGFLKQDASSLVPALLATLALVAFAANSIFCRLALGEQAIDPFAFTAVRLGSGALVLWLVVALRKKKGRRERASLKGALALSAYALAFSAAYVRVDTGTGALLLFAAVQITMLIVGFRSGERPSAYEWTAFAIAFGGLVYLVFPGLSAPDSIGALLMLIAGASWGIYSFLGKGTTDSVASTLSSFGLGALLVTPVVLLAYSRLTFSPRGVVLALASGMLTSGLGYVAWYAALRTLSTTRAALMQPAVPVLAAIGGGVFLAEPITLRLALAMAVVLGAIAFGTFTKNRTTKSPSQ